MRNIFRRFSVIFLCTIMILSSLPVTVFAAGAIDSKPERPGGIYGVISEEGIKNTYGSEYGGLSNRFVVNLCDNPLNVKDTEAIEFDIYV